MANARIRPRPPWLRPHAEQAEAPSAKPAERVEPVRQHRAADPYDTQIIPHRVVVAWYRRIVWTVLAISFSLSVILNIRMFGGDVTRIMDRSYLMTASFWLAFVSAFFYQVVVQLSQFRFADRRYWRQYLALIVASVIPSLWTLTPLIVVVQSWYKFGYVWWYVIAAIILGLNDFLQEQALQKRDA